MTQQTIKSSQTAALEAIANMKPGDPSSNAQLLALCIAMARIETERASAANWLTLARGPQATDCNHEWSDARNKVVQSGEVCLKCYAIRSGNTRITHATSPYLNKPLRTVEQAVRDSEGKL